jgi:hypothetical protein
MDEKISKLIDESIKVELNVTKIYMFFSDTFSEKWDSPKNRCYANKVKVGIVFLKSMYVQIVFMN